MALDTASVVSFALLGLFMVIGLAVFERSGLRMGGVLVLPLLVVYALFDLSVLLVFAASAVVTFGVGEVVHRQTLVYGRRMFVAYLLVGIASAFLAAGAVGVNQNGLLMAVLPGLFAFNLHREARPARGVSTFLLWLGALVLLGAALMLAAGARTPSIDILGPPLVAAGAIVVDYGGVVPQLIAVYGLPFLGNLASLGGHAAASLPPGQVEGFVAAAQGLPGAGGLSVLGIIHALLGASGE